MAGPARLRRHAQGNYHQGFRRPRARENRDMRERLAKSGVGVFNIDAVQFTAFFKREVEKWTRVVKEKKLKAE